MQLKPFANEPGERINVHTIFFCYTESGSHIFPVPGALYELARTGGERTLVTR
jgi:hypothetical protein